MEKRFVKDYELDESGKGLIYNGKEYPVEISASDRKKAVAFAFAEVAAFIGMFLSGNYPTRWMPVGIPFTLLIIFIPLFCVSVSRFRRLPFPMERRHYEGAFTYIGIYTFINLLLSAAVCVAFVFWVFETKNISASEMFFPVCSFAIALLSAFFFKNWLALQRKLPR